jgi:hypothetical protein
VFGADCREQLELGLTFPGTGKARATSRYGEYSSWAKFDVQQGSTNFRTFQAFREQVIRHWFKALRRRSQRTRMTWARMRRLIARWLPPARVMHPFPYVRFNVRT